VSPAEPGSLFLGRLARWLADVSAEAAGHAKSRPEEKPTGRPDARNDVTEAEPAAQHKARETGAA
jgi:hypothetical protein